MNVVVVIATAVATGAVVAALVVAAMRRQAAPVIDPGEDLRGIQRGLGELIGRVEAGFDQASRDHGTVRSSLDMLTNSTARRGTWGEVTLRRLLERAGLADGVDYATQVPLDGGRPDALIDLGPAGTVVIDAKAPLADLARAWEADTDVDCDAALRSHAATVRRHARDLAARDYPSLLQATFAPVVMYLPVDGAWEAATHAQPDLASELLAIGIHPASPSTLGLVLSLLKHHALTVDHEAAIQAVLTDTRDLIGRLSTHIDHLEKMGRALTMATDSYNKARGNLVSRVLPVVGRMADHIGERAPAEPGAVLEVVRSESLPTVGSDQVA